MCKVEVIPAATVSARTGLCPGYFLIPAQGGDPLIKKLDSGLPLRGPGMTGKYHRAGAALLQVGAQIASAFASQ